jgi:hypothetical protein
VRKNPFAVFDLRFRILRDFLFMRKNGWRERLAFPVIVLLSFLVAKPGSSFQPQAEFKPAPLSRENLEYEVEWRLVSAGKAKLSISDTHSSTKIRREMKMHLESTGMVSRLFHVNDDYTANSAENYCAESTYMEAREGTREKQTKVNYDVSAHKAFYLEHDLIKNINITHDVPIPNCTHDIIGGLYQVRTMPLEPGKTFFIPVSDGKRSVNLKVECQRREEIKTLLGPRKTLLCEVFAFNDVLFRRPGHVHIWFSDDARRVPLKIEIRLQFTIGTVTLLLAKDDKI